MGAVANAFASAVRKNSALVQGTYYDVTFDSDGAVSMEDTSQTVPAGTSFCSTLHISDSTPDHRICVTMDGEDITEACCQNHSISIPAVTGNIHISFHEIQRQAQNFRWEFDSDIVKNIPCLPSAFAPAANTKTTGWMFPLLEPIPSKVKKLV